MIVASLGVCNCIIPCYRCNKYLKVQAFPQVEEENHTHCQPKMNLLRLYSLQLPSIGMGIDGKDVEHTFQMFIFVMFWELSSQPLATSWASARICLFNQVANVDC